MDIGAREKHLIDILIRAQNLTDPAFRKAESNVQNLGRHMRAAGGMVAGGAALYAAGVGASVVASGRLDDSIVDSLTLIHTEGDEYEKLKGRLTDASVAMAKQLGVSASQVAQGYYQVLSTGAEILSTKFDELTATGIKFSRTVGLDLAQSVEMLNDTLNAFGPAASNVQHVADVLFKASALSATTVPQLSEAMREAGPAAASVGAKFEETAALLANFAQKGVKGAEAGTALRMVLLRLAAPTGEAATVLDQLNVSLFDSAGKIRPLVDVFEDLQRATANMTDEQRGQTLETIAGDRAFAKLGGILLSDLNIVRDWQEQLKKGGDLDEAYSKKLNTLAGRWNEFKGSILATAVALGEKYQPAVANALVKTSETVYQIAEWIKQNDELVRTVSKMVFIIGGAGGLIFIVGSLMTAITKMAAIGALAFGPGGLIALGIIALGIGIGILSNNINKARMTLEELETRYDKNKDKIAELKKGIDELGKADTNFAETMSRNQPFLDRRRKELEKLEEAQAKLERKKFGLKAEETAPKTLEEANALIGVLTGRMDGLIKTSQEYRRENTNILVSQRLRYDIEAENIAKQIVGVKTLRDTYIKAENEKAGAALKRFASEAGATAAAGSAGKSAAQAWKMSFADEATILTGELPEAIASVLTQAVNAGVPMSKLDPGAARAWLEAISAPLTGNVDYLRRRAEELAAGFGEEYRDELLRFFRASPVDPSQIVDPEALRKAVTKVFQDLRGSMSQEPIAIPFAGNDQEGLALTQKKLEDMAEHQGLVQSRQAEQVVRTWQRAYATVAHGAYQTLYRPMQSFFSQTLKDGRSFSKAWTDMWRGIRDQFLDIISDMIAQLIAKWVASKILSLFGMIGLPGFAKGGTVMSGGGGSVSLAESGGEITTGPWGKDVIPIFAQRGETVLDRRLTDTLRAALTQEQAQSRSNVISIESLRALSPAAQSGRYAEDAERRDAKLVDLVASELDRRHDQRAGTHITIKPGIATFSRQEAVRYARITTAEINNRDRRFVAKGR